MRVPLCDLRNQGKDVVLVHPVPWVERKALGLNERPKELAQKQACASVGQGMLDDDLSGSFQ